MKIYKYLHLYNISMKSAEITELREDDSIITLPATCAICSEEIDVQNNTLVRLDERADPLCQDHTEHCVEIVSVERHHGYPHNNIHPKTKETGWLDDTTVWYEVTDRELV